jgi:uncharacterized protein (DUF4415 family)
MKHASLQELRQMKKDGKIKAPSADAPEGEVLPSSFWENAKWVAPERRSVHLRLDAEIFDYFVNETGGKGHLTRMQSVLKAYVAARKAG